MTNIPIYLSIKFEKYILKIALVINENVRFAFIYVLIIQPNKYGIGMVNVRSTKI